MLASSSEATPWHDGTGRLMTSSSHLPCLGVTERFEPILVVGLGFICSNSNQVVYDTGGTSSHSLVTLPSGTYINFRVKLLLYHLRAIWIDILDIKSAVSQHQSRTPEQYYDHPASHHVCHISGQRFTAVKTSLTMRRRETRHFGQDTMASVFQDRSRPPRPRRHRLHVADGQR